MNTKRMSLVGIAVVAATALGAQPLLAEGGEDSPPTEPGIPYVDETPNVTEAAGEPEAIVTSGTTYDPTILTKFIPGSAFNPKLGDSAEFEDDRLTYIGSDESCVAPGVESGGGLTELLAGVELPDGALVKRVIFFGTDDHATNIDVIFGRTSIDDPPIGSTTRTHATVASFDTGLASGVVAIASPDNLDELMGNFSFFGVVSHRFHTVGVTLRNAALTDHVLCGVEVQYQVLMSAEDPGTVFHPISPVRAFDSRNPAYAGAGLLAPNGSKVISIKDGHDAAGVVNAVSVVPPGATAIAYNITIGAPTGPNFVAVTPGDAAGFVASAINFNGTADIANAGIVGIDAARQITVWGGDQSGSAHVIIDVTGYYAPPVPVPNMGG